MIKDTELYDINLLDKLNICCGYYEKDNKIYYFDDFSKVNEENYTNIFYFMAETNFKQRSSYTLNSQLFNNNKELLYKAELYKKDEYYKIGIKLI